MENGESHYSQVDGELRDSDVPREVLEDVHGRAGRCTELSGSKSDAHSLSMVVLCVKGYACAGYRAEPATAGTNLGQVGLDPLPRPLWSDPVLGSSATGARGSVGHSQVSLFSTALVSPERFQ